MSHGDWSVTLTLLVCLLAGCASTPPSQVVDVEDLKHGFPLGGSNSEVSKIIRDPSMALGGGGSGGLLGDLISRVIPGTGVQLNESHRHIKEAIPPYKVTEESASQAVSHAAQDIGKTVEKAASDTGKAIERLVLDRKPPAESRSNVSSSDSTKSFQDRIGEFLASLKKATYAFNPPSPIMVAKPTTIYLLLEPLGDAVSLIERIKELAPQNSSRIVHGEAKWASVMEASLSGRDFEIEPHTPTRKTLNPSERATWSWVITPKHPGEKLPLILTTKAILPSDFAPPYEVILLHREIDVQVTIWWLFDHYFDKYWKWLLGGVAGLATGLFGWWWKERQTAPNPALKRTPRKRRAA